MKEAASRLRRSLSVGIPVQAGMGGLSARPLVPFPAQGLFGFPLPSLPVG